MIDTQKREEKERKKAQTRKRMHVEIDPDNYEYTPAKKPIDYYDTETPQRVAIYVRVSLTPSFVGSNPATPATDTIYCRF